LQELNQRQPRAMPADVKRPSPNATAANWKGQSGYAGAKDRDKMSSQERIAAAQPGYSKPATAQGKAGTRDLPKAAPKVQGNYAGAKPERAKPASLDRPAPSTRDVQKPKPQGDRGYTRPEVKPAAKPSPTTRPAQSAGNRTAMSGAKSGQADRAASQRGKQSLPQGARSKGAGGGGGGGKKQKR
jgi:hypothetical protein